MASKPSIPKGTRDFSPAEVSKRQYIIQIIKHNFEKFGFQPIETPSFENSETLMGKYGEEGDRLIFKILNSGDYFSEIKDSLHEYQIISSFFNERFFLDFYKLVKDKHAFSNIVSVNQKFSDCESQDIKSSFGIFIQKRKSNIESSSKFNKNEKSILDKLINNNEGYLYTSFEVVDIVWKKLIKLSWDVDINKFRMKLFSSNENNNLSNIFAKKISEKALRYDLTVPFARYIVQNQNDILFPFKRYQIQPVWRADKPQKGRYREFLQCDADVVGSKSLWQEVELVQLYDTVFTSLGLEGVTIKINNRKILSGIAEVIGASDKLIDFTVALDKLDKIGEDGVKKEMIEKGIAEEALVKVQPLFNFSGTFADKISQLSDLLAVSEEGMKGVEELKFICDNVATLGLATATLDLDVTLARGLNYYTGAIFEVAAPKTVSMGSIGGGGRYDDLTGIFGLKDKSGVGISFGLDRIYLVLEELQLFPETVAATSKALFLNYGDAEALYASQAIQKLRQENIKVELYPDNVKVGKQFQYADKRLIPFVVIAGEQEIAANSYSLKNLVSGEQISVDFEGLKAALLV